jgi:hypothetical protein
VTQFRSTKSDRFTSSQIRLGRDESGHVPSICSLNARLGAYVIKFSFTLSSARWFLSAAVCVLDALLNEYSLVSGDPFVRVLGTLLRMRR